MWGKDLCGDKSRPGAVNSMLRVLCQLNFPKLLDIKYLKFSEFCPNRFTCYFAERKAGIPLPQNKSSQSLVDCKMSSVLITGEVAVVSFCLSCLSLGRGFDAIIA